MSIHLSNILVGGVVKAAVAMMLGSAIGSAQAEGFACKGIDPIQKSAKSPDFKVVIYYVY
jgi:hypothetical protein